MRAAETVERYDMLPRGSAVLAAFSGGADSSALLRFLCSVRGKRGLRVFAAHVNHGLRGAEADRDEAFVRGVCRAWGVPLFAARVDVRAEAEKTGESEELCGRRLRYAFFEKTAAALGARIATAHTLSDCVETVLFNLARGTGLAGLCGIPPVRGNIVRPLIETTRAEVEAYCRENGLDFVTDSTNFSRVYGRNRVRLDVVPALRTINPSLEKAVLREIRLFAADEAFLRGETEKLLARAAVPDGYCADVLAASPLCGRALELAARKATGIPPEAVHVQELAALVREKRGAPRLKGGWQVFCRQGVLTFQKKPPAKPAAPESRPLAPGTFAFGPVRFTAERVFPSDVKKFESFCSPPFHNAVDCDKISDTVVLRTREPGDAYHPAGRKVGKTLKKLMNEAGVPPSARPFVPVVADEKGIVWAGGFGPDARCVPDARTRAVWLFTYQMAEGENG